MPQHIFEHLTGLTEDELTASRKQYDYNKMDFAHQSSWLQMLLDILKEPMLILLIVISFIYVLAGNYGEAAFMFAALVAISAISFYQDNRSKRLWKNWKNE